MFDLIRFRAGNMTDDDLFDTVIAHGAVPSTRRKIYLKTLWTIPLSEHELDKMLKAIVGFSIEITRVEAKFKLGQNRSTEDQESMLRGLRESGEPGSLALAKFIAEQREL